MPPAGTPGMEISPAYQLCEPHHFDLAPLVEKFLTSVLEGQEVIGFAIPCDYSQFLEIFCKRIEDAIQKDDTFKGIVDIRKPPVSRYDPINRLIDEIKKIKFKNPHRYIIIPIKLELTNKDLAQLIWQKIYDEFHTNTQHVIIVVLMGRSNNVFPESMISLTPSFTEGDAHYWRLKVCARLGWQSSDFKAKWNTHMRNICLVENLWDMESTYAYINDVRSILQKNPDLSFDDFIYMLETGVTLYEQASS